MAVGYHLYGLRDARKIVRDTKRFMGRDQQPYARGWKAACKQIETLLNVNIAYIEAKVQK